MPGVESLKQCRDDTGGEAVAGAYGIDYVDREAGDHGLLHGTVAVQLEQRRAFIAELDDDLADSHVEIELCDIVRIDGSGEQASLLKSGHEHVGFGRQLVGRGDHGFLARPEGRARIRVEQHGDAMRSCRVHQVAYRVVRVGGERGEDAGDVQDFHAVEVDGVYDVGRGLGGCGA